MEKSVEQRTMSKVAWRLLPLIVIIYCEDQAEVDHFWEKFSEGGEKRPCGWLKDKFGLSWQIVPVDKPGRWGANRFRNAVLRMAAY